MMPIISTVIGFKETGGIIPVSNNFPFLDEFESFTRDVAVSTVCGET
jgi:hypothetical protein